MRSYIKKSRSHFLNPLSRKGRCGRVSKIGKRNRNKIWRWSRSKENIICDGVTPNLPLSLPNSEFMNIFLWPPKYSCIVCLLKKLLGIRLGSSRSQKVKIRIFVDIGYDLCSHLKNLKRNLDFSYDVERGKALKFDFGNDSK